MSASAPFISVVVPVYNSAAAVSVVHRRLAAVLAQLAPPERGGYEIIFVDDASADGSWQAICNLHQAHHQPPNASIVGVRLSANTGQHTATLCGLRQSHGQYMATLDDDLQQPPEALPELLLALDRNQADVAYAKMNRQTLEQTWRIKAQAVGRWLYIKLGGHEAAYAYSYRLLRGSIRPALQAWHQPHLPSLDLLLHRFPIRFCHIPVESHASILGHSRYQTPHLIARAIYLLLWQTAVLKYVLWLIALLPILLETLCLISNGALCIPTRSLLIASYISLITITLRQFQLTLTLRKQKQHLPLYIIREQIGYTHSEDSRT